MFSKRLIRFVTLFTALLVLVLSLHAAPLPASSQAQADGKAALNSLALPLYPDSQAGQDSSIDSNTADTPLQPPQPVSPQENDPCTREQEPIGQQRLIDAPKKLEIPQGRIQQTTNPSIRVNETYNSVQGYTDPEAYVDIVLKDNGGNVKDTQYTYADMDGFYYTYFYTDTIPGDIIEVTANYTQTNSFTVDNLTGKVDHINNRVTGTAPAGRDMVANLYQNRASCESEYDFQDFSSGTGSFNVTFPSITDIIRGAYTYIWCYDANGNATAITRYAPVLWVDHWMRKIFGYVQPYATYTAVLKNSSGGIKETVSGTANSDEYYYDSDGYYWAQFTKPFVPGDWIEVTSSGETMTMPIVNLTGNVDATTDTVYGTAHEPGAALRIYPYEGLYCTTTVASSVSPYSYEVDFSRTLDLVEGDYAYVQFHSADYNRYQIRPYAYTCEETPVPNFTTHDNENNSHTGTCDGDMDMYLYNNNPPSPIEFNILVTETEPIESAWLWINAWDIDEEYGELDKVYFNGHFLGYLTGDNDTWSSSFFNIDPSWVQQGNNLVEIDIDVTHPGDPHWAVNVDWGQLLLNQVERNASFRSLSLDQTGYQPGDSIYMNAEMDTDLVSQTLNLEFNLIDPNGFIADSHIYNGWVVYGGEGGTYSPYPYLFNLPSSAESGIYQVKGMAFDATTGLLQDTETREFVVDNYEPNNLW